MSEPDAELTAMARATMPLAETLGLEIVAASPEEVRARLPFQERLCTAGGILHGGALMSLADAAGAYCAFLNLPGGLDRDGDDRVEDELLPRRPRRPRRRDLAPAPPRPDDDRRRDRPARRGRQARRPRHADAGSSAPD